MSEARFAIERDRETVAAMARGLRALATGPIRVVAPPCGSGTHETGIDDRGRRWVRVCGEMHGRTFGGAERCRVVCGPWIRESEVAL